MLACSPVDAIRRIVPKAAGSRFRDAGLSRIDVCGTPSASTSFTVGGSEPGESYKSSRRAAKNPAPNTAAARSDSLELPRIRSNPPPSTACSSALGGFDLAPVRSSSRLFSYDSRVGHRSGTHVHSPSGSRQRGTSSCEPPNETAATGAGACAQASRRPKHARPPAPAVDCYAACRAYPLWARRRR